MRPRLSARLLFAAIGALICLLTALALESGFRTARTGRWMDDGETRVLLFFFRSRNETERRLHEANAKAGDVEVILTWNSANDLDLHVFDPNDEEIYYGHPRSERTGGELDVDRNAHSPFTNQPVEHIYWPRGKAPAGRYRVYVNFFARHGGPDPTAYQVTVKAYGRVQKYTGTITYDYTRRGTVPGKLICEFTPTPRGFELAGMPTGFWRALWVIGLWSSLLALALTMALLAGLHLFYRRVYRRRFLSREKAALQRTAAILAGRLVWGFIAGAVAQAAYSRFAANPWFFKHPTVGHAVGLTLLGLILGGGLGGRIPHLPRLSTALAAMLAGLLSGRLFLTAVWMGSESWGRVLTAALLGLAIGLMVALIVEPPEEPVEFEDDSLEGMRPLSLHANRIGPAGKLRRGGGEPVSRGGSHR